MGLLLIFLNELINICYNVSVLLSNVVSIGSYNPLKQRLFGILKNFKMYEGIQRLKF